MNTTKISRSSHSDIVILQLESPIGESPILQLENQLRGNYDKNLFKYIETCLPISTLCVCSFLHNYFRPRFYFSLNGWQPWEVHRSTWPDVSLYTVFWNKEIDFLGLVVVLTYCILAIPFVRAISYIFHMYWYVYIYFICIHISYVYVTHMYYRQNKKRSFLYALVSNNSLIWVVGGKKHLKHSAPIKIHILLSSLQVVMSIWNR